MSARLTHKDIADRLIVALALFCLAWFVVPDVRAWLEGDTPVTLATCPEAR